MASTGHLFDIDLDCAQRLEAAAAAKQQPDNGHKANYHGVDNQRPALCHRRTVRQLRAA